MLFNDNEKWAMQYGSFMQARAQRGSHTTALLYVTHQYDHCIMVYDRSSLEIFSVSTPCDRASTSHQTHSLLEGYKFMYPYGKCFNGHYQYWVIQINSKPYRQTLPSILWIKSGEDSEASHQSVTDSGASHQSVTDLTNHIPVQADLNFVKLKSFRILSFHCLLLIDQIEKTT